MDVYGIKWYNFTMLHVIEGPAGSGKTTKAYELLLEGAKEHKERNYILVIPEQNRGDADEMEDEIKEGLDINFVEEMKQVLAIALVREQKI